MLISLFGFFVSLYLGRDEYRRDDSFGSARLLFGAQISPYLLGLLSAYILLILLGRRKVFAIGMDRYGIYNWWWGGCCHYPWERIKEVRAVPMAGARVNLVPKGGFRGYSNVEENFLGRIWWVRRGMRGLLLGCTRVDPGLLYQAMCFYLRHPELREELDDRRAIERIERDDYPEIAEEIRTHGHALPPEREQT